MPSPTTLRATPASTLGSTPGSTPGSAPGSAPSASQAQHAPQRLVSGVVHPLGDKARVLLCSVFGPYAQDDEFGSRLINPMELYHNQVTRVQGPFSLRMFHRSWGLMLIQANITAPCTLLDFPVLDRFVQEISTKQYDIIGISAIIPNLGKVKKMCELIRQYQPQATIVIGGHIANLPALEKRIDADHVVRGEGVRWFQHFLGQRTDQPFRHPHILSGIGARTLGITLSTKPGEVAATLIPSVGCPMGCNFCSTSAMFGGKGKFIDFYQTGDELFAVMLDLEKHLKVRSFFVMDENFLLHRPRALRLLELMKEHNKAWALYVFSSANVLRSYTIEQLVGLGISWVWMGLEGQSSQYVKLRGADTRELVSMLQSHGIRVLGSTIIGLEEHTTENLDTAIDYAVSHDTEFHQFMLYTPIPGTPLWAEMEKQGKLTDAGCTNVCDTHGQLGFNYRHAQLPPGSETQFLIKAFTRDFEVNGPSVVRMTRTLLAGWRRYRDCSDLRVRARIRWETAELATVYAGATWAARKWFADKPALRQRIDNLLKELYREFGWKARLAAPLVGRYVYSKLVREDARLKQGWTYEPPTFCEHTHQPGQAASTAATPATGLPGLLPDLAGAER
ncbi:MAG: cobalamin-dependent protein [Phycisphaeraceae bacterium]